MIQSKKEYMKQYNSLPEVKESKNNWVKLFRKERRLMYHEYLTDKECLLCESKKNLDFHHTNPKPEDRLVSSLICYGYSIDSINSEIKKCIITCRRCHKGELHLQIKGRTGILSELGKIILEQHNSGMYQLEPFKEIE
ncbi:MAG: hypothetical protein GPJ52_02770 [Candidatus Heimdallarchaeota archaeon]|nr:hypothetical protein [Candidatus Heimdallarchaeota archaeon]